MWCGVLSNSDVVQFFSCQGCLRPRFFITYASAHGSPHTFPHPKVANHPLLIRSVFDDEKVAKMAEIASAHGLYGGNCSYDRVHKELLSYSDHQLHQFASEPCNFPYCQYLCF